MFGSDDLRGRLCQNKSDPGEGRDAGVSTYDGWQGVLYLDKMESYFVGIVYCVKQFYW